ncbi:MAG: ribonuclease III [Rhizomicrobium sp.]
MIDAARIAGLQDRLGYKFHDSGLLVRALTHASVQRTPSNERLEFLGDRVLSLVIAERLHHDYPADNEGALSLKHIALVRGEACAAAAEAAGLSEYVLLAPSEISSGGRRKTVILAGVYEAVIAAIYLDGGIEPARAFILRYCGEMPEAGADGIRDPKTVLQEWTHARLRREGCEPVYRLIKREGPDHAPRFWVEVTVVGEGSEIGEGLSKRDAERAAAAALYARLSGKPA